MSRERNVEDIVNQIISNDMDHEERNELVLSLVRCFNPRGNPTDDYVAFLWNIAQRLEGWNEDQLSNIHSFLTVCETGDAGAPITGIIDQNRFARVFNDYSEIVERIFQNNDDLLTRIFGNEPYTLSNSAILFMIQKLRETPMCPYGSSCYRQNPQHVSEVRHPPICPYGSRCYRRDPFHQAEFKHPRRGGTTRKRRLNRNHTKVRKRHRNL